MDPFASVEDSDESDRLQGCVTMIDKISIWATHMNPSASVEEMDASGDKL